MSDEPTPQQRKLAVLIFSVILVVGLALTIYFLSGSTEEVEEADPPEEEAQEPVGNAIGNDREALQISFDYAQPAFIS